MESSMDRAEVMLESKEADKIGRHRFCVAPMMESQNSWRKAFSL
jgi:hypothetical protein